MHQSESQLFGYSLKKLKGLRVVVIRVLPGNHLFIQDFRVLQLGVSTRELGNERPLDSPPRSPLHVTFSFCSLVINCRQITRITFLDGSKRDWGGNQWGVHFREEQCSRLIHNDLNLDSNLIKKYCRLTTRSENVLQTLVDRTPDRSSRERLAKWSASDTSISAEVCCCNAKSSHRWVGGNSVRTTASTPRERFPTWLIDPFAFESINICILNWFGFLPS